GPVRAGGRTRRQLRDHRARVRGRAGRGRAARPAQRPRCGRRGVARRARRGVAGMTSRFYGPKIFVTDAPAGEWEQAAGLELPAGQDRSLERVWVITAGDGDGTLYAGCDPGGLFESSDGGV